MRLYHKAENWVKKSLSNKLYLAFFILILVTVLSVMAVTYFINTRTYRKQTENYNYQLLELFSEKMDGIITQIDRLSFFAYQPEIQDILMAPVKNAAEQAHKNSVMELKLLSWKTFLNFDFQVNGAYYLTPDEILMAFPYKTFQKDADYSKSDWYQKVRAARGRKIYFDQPDIPQLQLTDSQARDGFRFLTGRWIYGTSGSTGNGMLLFDITIGNISTMMEQMQLPSDTTLSIMDDSGNCLYLLQDDSAMTTPDFGDSLSASASATPFTTKDQNGHKYLINTFKSTETPWHYVLATSYSRLTDPAVHISLFICLTGILLCLAALLLGKNIIRSITMPLLKLQSSMEKISDNHFGERIEIAEQNEIGRLKATFNKMADRIDYLINCVYLEQLKEKQAKLDALQAQINPHFLYNTLGTIGAIAVVHDNMDIYQMSAALSDMFRYAVKQERPLVTLQDELTNLENYILIQKYRYGKRLHFSVRVPEELLSCQILVFTLQPLVENAIIHGLEPRPEGGFVSLSALLNDSRVVITITDNGAGISPGRLEELQAFLSRPPKNAAFDSHIGLKNVYERLYLFYEGNASLSIDSSASGTTCTVSFPHNRVI